MAVSTTTHGFRKPDGNEPTRNGDNEIAFNAQKADDLYDGHNVLLGGHEIRLSSVESAAFVGGGLLMEDPADPGFYIVGGP